MKYLILPLVRIIKNVLGTILLALFTVVFTIMSLVWSFTIDEETKDVYRSWRLIKLYRIWNKNYSRVLFTALNGPLP